MKKQVLSVVATLSLIVPMAIIGFAGLTYRVSAEIPFDFVVGNKQLKAGKYYVGRLSTINTTGTLIIRSDDAKDAVNFNVNGVTSKGDQEPRLIFRRYGNQYFLAQIFDGESNQGFGLMKSKTEREVAKKNDTITLINGKPELVTIVAQAGK